MGGLAGCSSGNNGGDDTETETTYYIGDTASHAGIEMHIPEYALVSRYVEWSDYDNRYPKGQDDWNNPPTAGGIFLFAHVVVTNNADKRQPFPDVGQREGINATYNGQEVMFFEPDNRVKSDRDDEYQSYIGIAEEQDVIREGAYTGVTIEGWAICEVPRAFDPTLLEFNTRLGPENQKQTKTWSFGNAKPVTVPEDYNHEIETIDPSKNQSNTSNSSQ